MPVTHLTASFHPTSACLCALEVTKLLIGCKHVKWQVCDGVLDAILFNDALRQMGNLQPT